MVAAAAATRLVLVGLVVVVVAMPFKLPSP